MKLTQLADAVSAAMQYERHPENVDVVITTQLPYATWGQRPCTGIAGVCMGFDWEAGQFRITPDEKLMCVKHDVPQKVIAWEGVYCCPKCEHQLAVKRKNTSIRFCYSCGQAVKWE